MMALLNRRLGLRLFVSALALGPLYAHEAWAADCAPFGYENEVLDYTAGSDRAKVAFIERNHFDSNTENLVEGISASVGGDIDYLVRYVPNHQRGLASLVRLALKNKNRQPEGLRMSVECYLLRALDFKPLDVEVHKIYGTYLARLGRSSEALQRFELAEKLAPDDPVTSYNIGLILADMREFERARSYAKKAYAGGVQLPGLRDKLTRVGQWR